VEVQLLGALVVTVDGSAVAVRGAKERAVLSLLALRAGSMVSTGELVDVLWGSSPPPSALRGLHNYVANLRRVLPAGVVVTVPDGYRADLAPEAVDALRFERTWAAARGTKDPASTAAMLGEALSWWRGPPVPDLAASSVGGGEATRLGELRAAAQEDLYEARLALGEHVALVADLEAAVAAEPLRERRWAQLMLALYRSGRQADALRAFQRLRRTLVDELGLEPSAEMRAREAAVLAQDVSLNIGDSASDVGQPVDGGRLAENGEADLGLDPAPGFVRELVVEPKRGLPSPERAILARDGVDLTAPATVPIIIEGGPAGPAAKRARQHRRRPVVLAAGAVLAATVLVGVLVGVGVKSSGGGAPLAAIPADAVGAVSPSAGAIRAEAALGTDPSSLAGGDGSVWVTNSDAGTVARIDGRTRAVVETLPVGSSPTGIAVGAGAVWVSDNLGESVERVDPAVDRVVQTIAVGNGPDGVAAGEGAIWVANSSDGTLSRIDPTSGDVVATVALGAAATDVATGAGAVWVSDETGDCVFRVDPQSDQVSASIHVGSGPTALASGFGSVWVANNLDGTVSRIDPHTNSVTATVTVGDGVGGLAVGAGGVWVTSRYAGTLSRLDPATNVVRRTIRVSDHPQGVAVVDGLVWVGAGPADTGHRGGTLTVASVGYADSMDPLLTQNVWPLLPLAYDGLTAYQRVGGSGSTQLVPDLAVSLPSPTDGGTTYTFQLRGGIRYSNGELVRPEDFRRALQRELILGENLNYGAGPFADVVGGAACIAHPSHCDLSPGVVVDDTADTVTFHLMAPNPEFLDRLTLPDADPVPTGIPDHNIGLTPMPSTGAYQFLKASRDQVTLVRNPYFREWSHAARPDGYPDRIVVRGDVSDEAAITAVERGTLDYEWDGVLPDRMAEAQTQYASRLHIDPGSSTNVLYLNTRAAPFTDLRVRQAINYAVDRAEPALLGDDAQPACQILPVGVPGYRPYCPYTIDPNPAGTWIGPDLARAQRLIQASGTRGTPITIWDNEYDPTLAPTDHYLLTLMDTLGYPTRIKDFSGADVTAELHISDSRTAPQAILFWNPVQMAFPSAAQVLQTDFSCQSFVPDSTGNPNWSEFCDPSLDAQIQRALTAESNNAPDTAALWAQADQTATNQAPEVPLTANTNGHLVSARVGNYQCSFATGVLVDQLWVR
jgi:YVTN family beta-propeller protein